MAITNTNGTRDFVGMVLEVFKGDYQVFSDDWSWATWAKVWDGCQIREVLVNAHHPCCPSTATATVDATPETLAAASAWTQAQDAQRLREEQMLREETARVEASKPRMGRIVEVYKGRKIPHGTKGFVFWEGTDNYGNAKIGIATTNRKVQAPGKKFANFVDVIWVAASNCRAIPNQNEALAAFNVG